MQGRLIMYFVYESDKSLNFITLAEWRRRYLCIDIEIFHFSPSPGFPIQPYLSFQRMRFIKPGIQGGDV